MAKDSTNAPAARRYAQAVFELATERGDVDQWRDALDSLAAFMSEYDVKRALENPRYSQESKQQLIESGLKGLPPLALNLARLLARKGRTALMPEIAAEFRQRVEGLRGISHAKASTAVAMNDAERQALVNRLEESTGHKIVLETAVDPALLGGVVVQIGDKLVDASTRARLQALRDSLVGSLA